MQNVYTPAQKSELDALVASGAVAVKKHPTEDLYLYSYTRDYVRTPNENRWRNKLLNQCRGLILDGQGNVVSRPFPKFFNYEELEKYYEPGEVEQLIEGKQPELQEKIDGSLGILYWKKDGTPALCTRTSWTSDQAVRGTQLLLNDPFYSNYAKQLRKDRTYLFEIVYPENRLIVDYGNNEMLYLLAVIDTKTGMEYGFGPSFASDRGVNPGFPVPMQYAIGENDWQKCREVFRNHDNREGFVVRFVDKPCFGNVFRVKMKFKEYFELNFAKGKFTKAAVIRALAAKDPGKFEALQKDVAEFSRQTQSEETEIQVENYVKEFTALRDEWAARCLALYRPPEYFPDRKAWAEYCQAAGDMSPVLFKLPALQGDEALAVESIVQDKTVSNALWKLVQRDFDDVNKVFIPDEEN